jgi:hypothetical protein
VVYWPVAQQKILVDCETISDYGAHMTDKHDKLQMLRAKYLERIRAAETALSALKDKVRLIDELEEESDELDVSQTTGGKYTSAGLTEAALDAVQTLGTNGGVTAGKVTKYLISQGFKAKGKNLHISVGTTLRRLAGKQARLTSELKEGSRLYMPK